jgi:uncharacterized protein YggL (DUF469 family)
MSKGLLKKKRVGEFNELGFELHGDLHLRHESEGGRGDS